MARRRPQHLRRQAGQSVIIAIAVLFILAFLAAFFVVLLVRNFERVNRNSQTLTADFYAQSGIHYADQMLTTSPQGADWRPVLANQLSAANAGTLTTDEGAAYSAAVTAKGLVAAPANDPDKFWLDQGFSRINTQGGRFLLRLSYSSQPNTTSIFDNGTPQAAKYIKIESIGRTGEVDPTDPTTYHAQPIRLHAELVAYKPIGLVDYARFITNKYQRSDTATLGVPSMADSLPNLSSVGISTPGVYDFVQPATGSIYGYQEFPLVTTYGVQTTGTSGQGGALRCNGNLRLYGVNEAYLNSAIGDDWEVAGNLTFDGFAPATTATKLFVNGTAAVPSNVLQVTGSPYDTQGGLIRDGAASTDNKGFPRDIQRLNPPSLDTIDGASKLNRYAAVASNGQTDGPYNPATATSPATIYIDNSTDVQAESTNVVSGAYTLRDDWLNRVSERWQGPFYNPPGATVVFGPIKLGNDTTQYWGVTVTRTDSTDAGQAPTWGWTKPDGSKGAVQAGTMVFVYASKPAKYSPSPGDPPVYFLDADDNTTNTATNPNPNNDVVIYALGNVRVRGVISDTGTAATNGRTDHHVTLVTSQIAYIEGSILKGGVGYSAANNYTSKSSMAILAEKYVCVNTTQFLAGADVTTELSETDYDNTTNNSLLFNGNTLTEAFDLPPTSLYGTTAANALRLYVSQYATDAEPGYGEIGFGQATYAAASTNSTVYYDGAGDPASTTVAYTPVLQGASVPNREVVNLYSAFGTTGSTLVSTTPVGFQELTFTIGMSAGSQNPYLLERAAVLPSDIRIEAILYAQNNSFFVIPGPWFNSDTKDTIDKFFANGNTGRDQPIFDGTNVPGTVNALFPFYGQPIDMKVSIVGSVVENLPANISDQAAWMLRWGWIPKYHGTPGWTGYHPSETSPHPAPATPAITDLPGVGLNMQYDPAAGSSSVTVSGTTTYLRLDPYGRPLPYAPNLPVSPDLLYSGETSGNSLVQ